MLKNWYKKELEISKTLQTGDKGKEVTKVQQWLSIWGENNPTAGCATKIDADYGSATTTAVKKFQAFTGLPQSGVVNEATFSKLSLPLIEAHADITLKGSAGIRDYVLAYANLHLQKGARELQYDGDDNLGPWVRSYMLGNEGHQWFWCAGFVTTILDLAATRLGKSFTLVAPNVFGCDSIADFAIRENTYIPASKIMATPAILKPGDLFLVRKTSKVKWVYGWQHIGIITEVNGNGTIGTLEGNTNTDGSSNGIAVYARTRNLMSGSLDAVNIAALEP